jgi:hypothetical protein
MAESLTEEVEADLQAVEVRNLLEEAVVLSCLAVEEVERKTPH